MAKSGVFDYSTTAASNTDIDGTDISGTTGKVKDGDNAIRSEMSHTVAFALDLGGAKTTAGSANAQTVTLTQTITALLTGVTFTVKFGLTNTAAATLNVNSLGAKSIKVVDTAGVAADPPPGAMLAGNYGEFLYDGTNLVLKNPANVIVNSDAGAAAGPVLNLFRDSSSPAANDLLGQIIFNGRDSAANVQEYASIQAVVADPVSTTEDASLDHYAVVAGTRTKVMSVGPNLDLAAVGQIKFPATQNASSDPNTLDDYEEGTWAPDIFQSVAITRSSTQAYYTKKGRDVTINMTTTLTSAGTATNNIQIQTLPFAPILTGSEVAIGSWYYNDVGSAYYGGTAVYVSSVPCVRLVSNGSASLFGVNPAVTVANGDSLSIVLNYPTT